MLYNIKSVYLHCVFHGIRFKVNKDWVSGKIPFFFCVCTPSFFFCTNKRKTKQKENSPSAFFFLLQHFSPLNKKNSLRSLRWVLLDGSCYQVISTSCLRWIFTWWFVFSSSFASLAEVNTSILQEERLLQRAKRCFIPTPHKTSRSVLIFLPLSGSAFWSVKNKKLFEHSEFFLFSEEKYWSRKKNSDG